MILYQVMHFFHYFAWFCTYFEGFCMILEGFWWFWDGKSMTINENQWKSMKINENQWKSIKINRNQYKINFFRIHSVLNVDFVSSYAFFSLFCMILHIFWRILYDYRGFLVVLGWKIIENQWKSMKINVKSTFFASIVY